MNTTRRGFFGLLAGAVAALKLGPKVEAPLPAPPVLPPGVALANHVHGLRGIVDDGTQIMTIHKARLPYGFPR